MKNVALVVFGFLILCNFIFYNKWQNTSAELENAQEEYSDYIDSALAILALPPDTIYKPAKVIKGDVIYVDRWHDYTPPTAKAYEDSLVNDSIDVRVTIMADRVYSIGYAFKPIYRYQEKIIEKPVPYPVTQEKEVKVPASGLFGAIGLGYGDSDVALNAQLILITKKNRGYGLGYVRHGLANIYLANYLIKF